MKKKLLVIMLALAMVFAFAACGGGGGGGSDAPAADSSAEPNAGVSGIVFTVPDDWTLTDVNIGSHGSYSIPGSDYCLVTNSLGEKELEENNKWSEEKFDSVLNNGNLMRMRHFKEYIEVPDAINRVYDSKNEFKALYEWVENRKLYKPVKVFISIKE